MFYIDPHYIDYNYIFLDLTGMFEGCSSLKSLPDISNWNTSYLTSNESMFKGCSSLQSLSDISGWKTYSLENMKSMFRDCTSLKSLPDISKWDI